MSNAVTRARLWAIASLALFSAQATAQTQELFAGRGDFVDAPATSVPINPRAFAIAPDGIIYVADQSRGKMIRFDPATGTATSMFESGGRFGFLRGVAVDPAGNLIYSSGGIYRLDLTTGLSQSIGGSIGGQSVGLAVDAAGTIYASVEYGFVINEIRTSGSVYRFAGSFSSGFSGDGGAAYAARINQPQGIAVDAIGNVYFADQNNHRVRRVEAGTRIISTVVGTGERDYNGEGLPGLSTNIYRPTAVALDSAGNLYIAEENRVRRMDANTGLVTTFAGTGGWGYGGDTGPATAAEFSLIEAIAFDATGNLYIGDYGNSRLRRVDAATGIVTTVLGNGKGDFCGDNGAALDACIDFPQGIAVDADGNVFIADAANERIRRVAADTGIITTYAGNGPQSVHSGDGGPASAAGFGNWVGGLTFDNSGNLVVTGYFGNRIRRIDTATGIINTIAGTGVAGFSGDGGNAQLARFNRPVDVAVDALGNIFVADFSNHRIRRIDAATNVVTTFAGNGLSTGPLGDGGPAHLASLGEPNNVAFDHDGNLLISDRGHYRVRKVNLATGVITTIAGNGTNISGDNGPATNAGISTPASIAVGPDGSIYIGGYMGSIRKVDTAGIITTLAGVGGQYIDVLEFDGSGRLYFGDTGSSVIYRVTWPAAPPADTTPPVVTPSVSGTPGNNGWYRSNVQVSWTVTDPDSAVTSNGCSSTTVTEDTAGIDFTCTATSLGGTSTQTVNVKKDTAPPFATFGAPLQAPNAAGWYNANVSIPFTLTDTLSGVSHATHTSPITITSEGQSVPATLSVTDMAGNTAERSSLGVGIDKTPPTITLLYPEQGRTYGAFTTTNAQYLCNDNLSQQSAITCAGTVPHGVPFSTNPAGAKTFTVTATDLAGNQATASRSYSARAMVWAGWVALRKSFILNRVAAGSLVPIRWRQTDGFGVPVSNPAAFQGLAVSVYNCAHSGGAVVTLNDTATGGPGLTYSASTQAFTYNWQSDASWAGACRRVLLQFANGTSTEVLFQF